MSDQARQAYSQRVELTRTQLEVLDRRSARLANLRAASFVAGLVLFLLVAFEKLDKWWVMGSVACWGSFVVLVIRHAQVANAEAKARTRLKLNERGLARVSLKAPATPPEGQARGRLRQEHGWHGFPQTGASLLPETHLYARDLDVLGQGSIFQRLDDTGTAAGEAQLAAWLLTPPPSVEDTRARQAAVKELAPRLDFRQTLVAEARSAGEDKADPSRFITWAETPSDLERIRWGFWVAHVLPPLTWVSAFLAWFDVVPALVFWGGVLLHIAVVALTRRRLTRLWNALRLGDRGLVRFEETFLAVDQERFEGELLRRLQRGVQVEGPPVSERLARFARLLGFAELRQSGQLYPVINALMLWDLHVLFRIDRWRQQQGVGVRQWFEALAQLEALSSFATLAFEEPEWPFAEVVEGPFVFEARGLGHPLLVQPVQNDVSLAGPGQALVVTGSNMSGKTTLIRAMGLNAVMGLAGLPVCAQGLRLSRLQVLTSMRVTDSLERGVSYFYAEVARIRAVLEAARDHAGQCLFLLDELFMGTNTRERQMASRQLLSLLLDSGASGAITTHDLTLCEAEREQPTRVRNCHFRDEIRDGEMTFDYRLREGIVQTTNALEVLRRAGVLPPAQR